jgi:carbonic anhydrase
MPDDFLQSILDANREFVASRHAPAPSVQSRQLAIVACMEPALDRFIPEAFGLPEGAAHVIRNAGSTCTRWDETILRSVAVAVLRGGVRHVAVVGHTDCAMAADTLVFLDALQKAGVPRAAFGDRDPREWLGVLGGIEANVRSTLNQLKRSPLLPAGIGIHGLVIDTRTGELRSVASETTGGPAEIASRTTPRAGDSVAKVLGVSISDSFVPTAGFVPTVNAPRAVNVPPQPTTGPMPSAATPAEVPAPPSPPEPARVKANVRSETSSYHVESRDSVPLDPRAAQEFFRKREAERLKKKRL